MKSLLRVALTLAVLASVWSPVRAETADPPPILTDAVTFDARELVGRFDLGFGADDCPGGVCRTPRRPAVASSPAAPAPAANVAVSRRNGPIVNTLRAVREWYPGKAIQTIRAARQAGRCR